MFFIYDCYGNKVGNPKGYRTMRGAMAQADSVKTKIGRHIWALHDLYIEEQEKNGKVGYQIDRHIYSIR